MTALGPGESKKYTQNYIFPGTESECELHTKKKRLLRIRVSSTVDEELSLRFRAGNGITGLNAEPQYADEVSSEESFIVRGRGGQQEGAQNSTTSDDGDRNEVDDTNLDDKKVHFSSPFLNRIPDDDLVSPWICEAKFASAPKFA